MAAEGRITQRAAEQFAAGPYPAYDWVPLGVVPDGKRVAHVLFRNHFDPEQAWSGDSTALLTALPPDEQELARELGGRLYPRVATCRRQPDGSWRLLADHNFLQVGSVSITHVGDGDAVPNATPHEP